MVSWTYWGRHQAGHVWAIMLWMVANNNCESFTTHNKTINPLISCPSPRDNVVGRLLKSPRDKRLLTTPKKSHYTALCTLYLSVHMVEGGGGGGGLSGY